MNVSFTPDQARVFMGFIDTTLKAKGIEALDAAWLFKSKIQESVKKEQDEQTLTAAVAADSASQLG